MTVVEILPDDAALRRARRARVLAAMEAADVDFLIVGREGNARYVSGAPRLWTAGSRAFGPGCVFVRENGAVHLLSTWDEGIPEEIPHENLYGITFNAMNFVTVLSKIEGAATAQRVATDSMSGSSANLLPKAFPAAEFIDGEPMLRRIRRVKSPEEVEAIRASVRVAEEALAAATHALVPGVTERQLTAIFMEAMAAAGVTTPSGQDVAWITPRQDPWRRADRDAPAQAGDLVAFEAGVVLGGYSGELGRTYTVGDAGDVDPELVQRSGELWDRLHHACRVGAPLTDLLVAYDAAGVQPPPMPVARGLGLGFDLPLVTHALPLTAGEQHVEAGMVFALTGYVWKEGVGALYVQDPIVATESGPESLSTMSLRRGSNGRFEVA
jgi:Xaa-Pro dipeptidase